MAAGEKFAEFCAVAWQESLGAALIKWIELIASVICTILYIISPIPASVPGHWAMGCLLSMTFGGYVIVLGGSVVAYITRDYMSKRIELMYTLIGMALFIASGSVAIGIYSEGNYTGGGLAAGIIAILNSVVFLIDALKSVNISINTKTRNGYDSIDSHMATNMPTAPTQYNDVRTHTQNFTAPFHQNFTGHHAQQPSNNFEDLDYESAVNQNDSKADRRSRSQSRRERNRY